MISQFLISAPYSNAGKTTVTLGLLRALRRKGHTVQPFKCGPDFIDPIHHQTAVGRDSINLDLYMMSPGHIRDQYRAYTADVDVAITEGVMGLFDGAVKSEGSTADLAKLLGLPVILILDARAMAYTAAPILFGLRHFDPDLHLAGVIFNFVDAEGHYQLLQEAAADAGVTALGYLPENPNIHIPSRHLGLDTTEAEAAIEAAANHIERYLDIDRFLHLTQPSIQPEPSVKKANNPTKSLTILIAKDSAFLFLYPENIRRLEELGSLQYFSPLKDTRLPENIDLIYLPGGYPELYLPELSANTPLLDALRSYAAKGGKILAECGGMMYLGNSITDSAGKPYEMAGIIEIRTTMEDQGFSLGYRTIPLPGGTARGHEFHYSRAIGAAPDVFLSPGILATYMHFYWGEDHRFLDHWLKT
ncbi:MAG TPA: cobyrinate a,c-diamide synthase [Puia sp.]|jgi:cobyrinic acid a,c-diamide synthase|nr:cobyrinate a,c-diamide synthase [Puia sp.]